MDLQTMKTQMNTVIQKHQIVVNEMRNDPQNPILQKRLHELQLEIASLNARQQQILNEVRKKIGHSSPDATPTTNAPGVPVPITSPTPQTSNQEIRMVCCTQKCPVANHKMQTTTMVSKPVANCVNTVRQPVPPSLNNISSTPTATITFKGPVGTVVLPNCSTTNSLLSTKAVNDHPKMHPVLVVPSPSNRSVDGPQTGVLLNLVPPIRVPQYPPPSSPRTPGPVTCQKTHVVNSSLTVSSSPSPVSNYVFNDHSSGNTSSSPCEKSPPAHPPDKINNKIDQKKQEFITALGLVTRDSLSDIKNKKMERKRRSTANPQFSNAALEEKWKNAAAAAAAQAAGPQQKRPREICLPNNDVKLEKSHNAVLHSTDEANKGSTTFCISTELLSRPRLETKFVVCSTNGVCPSSDSPKTEPLSPPDSSTTMNSSSQSSSSPPNESPTLMNGVHKQTSSDEAKNVEQMLSGLCIVCTQPGDLVKCDTCAKQQHLGCMQPPLVSKPQGPWTCSDCQSTRTVSLSVVQSYELLKAAKEDEKRKLLKKSLELRYKRSQLESRLIHLKELSGKQKNRQSELQSSLKNVELLTERIHSIINGVKLCS